MIRARFNYNSRKTRGLLKDQVMLVQRKVAFQLLEGIVNMTPVDTGRAKGNWQVTLGAPSISYDYSKMDKAGGSTINAGSSTIESLTDYGTIYLTNNLPYIMALEKGRSTQAPVGMVQVTLDRVSSQFG